RYTSDMLKRGAFGGALVAIAVASCGSDQAGSANGDDGGAGDAAHGDGGANDASSDGASGDGANGDSAGGDGAMSCLGSAFLASLGKSKMIVGASMSDTTAKAAPFDLRYIYVSGGLSDGNGPCASCATGCTTKGTTCANSGPGCAW